MFMMVGFAEHAVIIESTPYDDTMFGGTAQIAMIGKDTPAVIAGAAGQVSAFGEEWARQPKDQPGDLGAMLREHAVCFIMRPADSITPVAYFRDATRPEGYSAAGTDPTQSYTYCHPGDEKSHLVTELKRAVMDFNAHPEERYPEVCQNIAQFLLAALTLPKGTKMTYVNFRTAGILSAELVQEKEDLN